MAPKPSYAPESPAELLRAAGKLPFKALEEELEKDLEDTRESNKSQLQNGPCNMPPTPTNHTGGVSVCKCMLTLSPQQHAEKW